MVVLLKAIAESGEESFRQYQKLILLYQRKSVKIDLEFLLPKNPQVRCF